MRKRTSTGRESVSFADEEFAPVLVVVDDDAPSDASFCVSGEVMVGAGWEDVLERELEDTCLGRVMVCFLV